MIRRQSIVLTAGTVFCLAGLFSVVPMYTAEAKKICKGGGQHFHFGAGQEQKTKHLAKVDAVAYWRGFTEFEYGEAWGRFRLAKHKKFDCQKLGARRWKCSVEAVPCRR